jgi:malate dehydrogenase (oxaloacetate-decarboxylating)(NADP+)
LLSAMRITGGDLTDQRFLFLGAGEAGIGIADLIVSALVDLGVSREDARRSCWFVDSRGLVVRERTDLAEHKKAYAHDAPPAAALVDAIRACKPTALIGVSGQPATFTREVLEAMAAQNERPIIFALSNPTANSECTAEAAYAHTGGRALFASGSPFPVVRLGERTLVPGQANNAYVFPGVALGVVASRASRVTDEMFSAAARTLADLVTPDALAKGLLFPPLTSIRDVSLQIATAVAHVVFANGLTEIATPHHIDEFVRDHVYEPVYADYVA